MSYDLSILRALVRLSRSLATPSSEALLMRAGGNAGDVRAAVARLERRGLALRTARGPRPTLAGLAVALAASPVPVSPHERGPRAQARARPPKAVRRVAA